MADIRKWEDAGQWVEVDLDLCMGAAECVEVCPVGVYEVVEGKVRAENIGECIACGACEEVCPNDAILFHWAW